MEEFSVLIFSHSASSVDMCVHNFQTYGTFVSPTIRLAKSKQFKITKREASKRLKNKFCDELEEEKKQPLVYAKRSYSGWNIYDVFLAIQNNSIGFGSN